MRLKGEVVKAVKQFSKKIGESEAIICDAASEKKSNDLQKFYRDIGTTLRVLEKETPWDKTT